MGRKDDALREALRFAIDPRGGVSIELLRELARGDDATERAIAATGCKREFRHHLSTKFDTNPAAGIGES